MPGTPLGSVSPRTQVLARALQSSAPAAESSSPPGGTMVKGQCLGKASTTCCLTHLLQTLSTLASSLLGAQAAWAESAVSRVPNLPPLPLVQTTAGLYLLCPTLAPSTSLVSSSSPTWALGVIPTLGLQLSLWPQPNRAERTWTAIAHSTRASLPGQDGGESGTLEALPAHSYIPCFAASQPVLQRTEQNPSR